MLPDKKLDLFTKGFESLSEKNKEYILAISQALVFAQSSMNRTPSKNAERVNGT